jgi:hypothetical protein
VAILVVSLASAVLLAWSAAGLSAGDGQSSLHRALDEVLEAHVDNGDVNYPGIVGDPRFSEYIDLLAQYNPAALESRQDQLAFWINAYNALAIKGIIDGGSPGSFFGRIGYFKTTQHELGEETINLYDLERDVIIPLGEPRIHFAIVCASFSCPMLRSEAYTAERLDEQLELNTRHFINDPTRNRFDRDKKVAHLSKIFDWFPEDFEKHSGSVLGYIANYVNDPDLAKALREDSYKIKYLKYDWSLNGTAPKTS